MKKYSQETVAGIFVFIGLLALVYMAVKLGELSLFGDDTYLLTTRFSTVSGLREGNPVEMLGIEVGKVEKLSMDQEKQQAVASLKIKKGVQIYSDAMASIKTAGLIGDRFVSISPGGGGELLKPCEAIVETEPPMDIAELIKKYAFGSIKKDESSKEQEEKN